MIKMRVRQKYQGLSPQELLDKAYELGFNYEKMLIVALRVR